MSKRSFEEAEPSPDPSKRRKTGGETTHVASVSQLQHLLSFRQDAAKELRDGVGSFKAFLESIIYAGDKDTASPCALLKAYLIAETPKRDSAPEQVCLPSLMQTWSYAAQAHNDALLSAVPAVLALLFKTISTLVEFRELGQQLGKTVLQQSQLKLIGRALSGPKHKEHLISPCLRLLTEIVSFDGGVIARQAISVKFYTFDAKTIARDLSLHHSFSEQAATSARHPSVRSNTIRYVLANLKFQPTAEKIEILNNSNVFRALFDHAKFDSPEQLQHMFDSLKSCVLTDDAIPRSSKRYVFNDHNLSSIASIYRHSPATPENIEAGTRTDAVVHSFLLYVCTHPNAAILRQASGFYPPGADQSELEISEQNGLDLGLDSIEWYHRYTSKVPVQNSVLSRFLQTLRPYATTCECELVSQVFRDCPELVADYFFNKSTFAFDPKLTTTWIGYSAFLFSVVKLPVPPFFGRNDGFDKVPPPMSILMQSILPQPLTQKVLSRCLNQQQDLIIFFATRILTLALQKLQNCSQKFSEAARLRGKLWEEGVQLLRENVAERCPPLKDVIGAFRRTNEDNVLQREALLRLLGLYYSTMPSLVAGESFDVSMALDDALRNFEDGGSSLVDDNDVAAGSTRGLRILQLDHLLQIAHRNTSLRWWYKPESRRYTPFMSLLSIIATTAQEQLPRAITTLLETVIDENDIFQRSSKVSAVRSLIVSLAPNEQWAPNQALFVWLDEVLSRNIRKPIKYLDDLDSFADDMNSDNAGDIVLSPFWMTLTEQWPFAVARNASAPHIAEWLSRYLEACRVIGEDQAALSRIRLLLVTAAGSNKLLKARLEERHEAAMERALRQDEVSTKVTQINGTEKTTPVVSELQAEHFRPPDEPEVLSDRLHKPLRLDISDAASTGAVGSLIMCVSSLDSDVRNQALTNLNILTKRLSTPQSQSNFPPSKQLYLLLGILTNTASQRLKAAASTVSTKRGDEDDEALPVPFTITAFASMAVVIISTPNHPLYDKINRFLLRGPTWDPARMPTYWVQSLLRSPPSDILPPSKSTLASGVASSTEKEAQTPTTRFGATLQPLTTLPTRDPFPQNPYHAGVNFFVSYIYHALRTPADLAILRRRSTFEPLLALVSDPFMPGAIKDVVLAILWRATWLDGGSTTLVTRAGAVAWLCGLMSRGESRKGLLGPKELRALVERMWETCDRERVAAWSGGSMGESVEGISGMDFEREKERERETERRNR